MHNKFRSISKFLFSPRCLIFTNSVIGSSSLVCGYAIAGKFRSCFCNDSEKTLTWPKIKLVSVLGAFYGSYETVGYYFIDKIKIKRALFLKMLLDQTLLGPPAVALFLLVNESFDHNWDWKYGIDYTKKSFLPVYFLDMIFWIPAQFVNFRFVHPKFRFAYVAGASVLGHIVLASLHLQFQNIYRFESDIISSSTEI